MGSSLTTSTTSGWNSKGHIKSHDRDLTYSTGKLRSWPHTLKGLMQIECNVAFVRRDSDSGEEVDNGKSSLDCKVPYPRSKS